MLTDDGQEADLTEEWLNQSINQSTRYDNDIDAINQSYFDRLIDRLIDRLKELKRLCNTLSFCLCLSGILLLTWTIIAVRDRPAGLSPPGRTPPAFDQFLSPPTNQPANQPIDSSTNQSINDLSAYEPRLRPRPSLHASSCAKHYPIDQPIDQSIPKLAKPNRSYRYFIAINLFNNDEILPDFFQELHRLFTSICEPATNQPTTNQQSTNQQFNRQSVNHPPNSPCVNVFVSIYESGSTDQTKKELTMFSSYFVDLGIPHAIVSTNQLIKQPNLYRIEHLAAVRNKALAPFFELHENAKKAQSNQSTDQSTNQSIYQYERSDLLFDKIIWLNDIIYCAEDVIRLINTAIGPSQFDQSTNQSIDQSKTVHMACGLDFWEHAPIAFYDTWVMRGLDGSEPRVDYPWFTDQSMKQGVTDMKNFPVFCCWNGLVVMSAWEWLEYGITFRAHDDESIGESTAKCEASECSHVCENYWAIHGEKTHIVVDPLINVAYRFDVYEQIESSHWFHHANRKQTYDMPVEQVEKSLDTCLVDHKPVPWKCRDLDWHYSEHPVTIWSEEDKVKRKNDYAEKGWGGWKQMESVANFGKQQQ